ncbi:alpha/beta fold hydrolase [Actinokineospora globicatena]|uniref:alpha/beta fold hydrolase n=1 Tax=Actinokineospora globicatena TaxID=103729 RepID=UPI0020A2C302|nr:alpha/beta hydrolase [Actinokineospora globicatena]GLW76616.1 alpha/beta hydrolase [Actinokineospora globicatena]GLW83450.1 alpha/beta hydrolase [Actinokineospora globicatena]
MRAVTSADGTGIAVEVVGSGVPVVLVGGAFNDRNSTADLGGLLAEAGLSAVSYDRRGRGDSSDTQPYAVEREIEDLAAVLESVGGSVVYGMSSGGILVLLAALQGLGISRVAVYEPPFNDDPSEEFAEAQARRSREEAVEAFLATTGMPPQEIDGMRQGPAWPYLLGLAHTLSYDARIVARGSTDALAALEIPVLVVDGDASPPFLRDAAKSVAEAVPNATKVSLPDQTHNVDIRVLAPELVRFFS